MVKELAIAKGTKEEDTGKKGKGNGSKSLFNNFGLYGLYRYKSFKSFKTYLDNIFIKTLCKKTTITCLDENIISNFQILAKL